MRRPKRSSRGCAVARGRVFSLEACESRVLLAAAPVTFDGPERGALGSKSGEMSKAGSALAGVYQEYLAHEKKGKRSAGVFATTNPAVRMQRDRVAVEAVAVRNGKTLEAELKKLGMTGARRDGLTVTGYLPAGAIGSAVKLASLRMVRPVAVVTSAAGPAVSQGERALLAAFSRGAFGVDGTGVKVAVISDSFNALGGYGPDVTAGELPRDIAMLSDAEGTDEGRAMLQIIHDLAPGATLMFHDAGLSQQMYAGAIDALVEAGADVIVDDIMFLEEAMFQDGPVARAVDRAVANGVAYFSAAGNSGTQSYEAAFADSGVPIFLGEDRLGVAHDFDPGAGVDILQSITIPEGATMILELQWDQPFRTANPNGPGSASDIDVFLVDELGTTILAAAWSNNLGADAAETMGVTNPVGSGLANFNLMITNFDGPNPGLIKYVLVQGNDLTINEYETASGTLYGHANAAGAMAVGAAAWFETPEFGAAPAVLERYSSGGVTEILFDASGNRLAAPVRRPGPQVVGVDGVNTSFFGGVINDGDVFPNFFGTSAAAPHVAAIAALMKQANSAATPARIYRALIESAQDLDDPSTSGFDVGWDLGSGAGLVSADRALLAITRGGASGAAFNDRNGNGTRDAGEEGLAGTKVFLDLDGDGAVSTLAPVTVNAPGLPAGIPSPGTLISGLTLADFVGDIAKVVVTLNVTHPYVGELAAFLLSPEGTRVDLFSGVGGAGNHFVNTRFDGEAATPIGGGAAPFTGTFRPVGDLSRLVGEDPNGTWRLQVMDGNGFDVGALVGWSLTLTLSEPVETTDAAGGYAFGRLPPGSYTVRAVPPAGMLATSAGGAKAVLVADAGIVGGQDLGLQFPPVAKVIGSAYLYESAPQGLVFRFSADVTGLISVDDLELVNVTTGQVVPTAGMSLSYNAAQRLAIWTIGGRLADGNYVARIRAAGVMRADGAALDGNGDGIGGDDFVLPFFQLTGDANRDRVVDHKDFAILNRSFGKAGATWNDGDFNYDGRVNFTDFQMLEVAFNRSLPTPVASAVRLPAVNVLGTKRVVKVRDFRSLGHVLT